MLSITSIAQGRKCPCSPEGAFLLWKKGPSAVKRSHENRPFGSSSKGYRRILRAGFCLIAGVLSGWLWTPAEAAAPLLKVRLNFFQRTAYYRSQAPIPFSIEVFNAADRPILIRKGFRESRFALQMRILDPANRLLVPGKGFESHEFPDAPPLPFVGKDNKLVQAVPCETLPPRGTILQKVDDLRRFYPLTLPGYYSVQVQLPVMLFKAPPCNLSGPLWSGVAKSEMHSFFMEGETQIRIIPDHWRLSWTSTDRSPVVKIEMDMPKGRAVNDVDFNSIRMNNLKGKIERQRGKLTVYYAGRTCVHSLSSRTPGKRYRVIVTGKYRSGEFFGGAREILLIK